MSLMILRFLHKAAIISEDDKINPDGTAANPWKLCSMQKVEELKSLVRLIPIWFAGIIYFVFITMMENYAVFQALQLNRHLGRTNFQIPAASFIGIALLTTSLWLVIYDKVIVPVLHKFTGKEGGIKNIDRIAIGIAIAILAMVVSAIVEKHRRTVAIKSGLLVSPLSWGWLVPQLIISGLSLPFGVVGVYELYYKEVPDSMKSIGGSFYYCGSAISSYLSTFILSMVQKETTRSSTGNWLSDDLNKGRLDYFYYLMAGLQLVNLVYFMACAKWYNSKGFNEVIPDMDHGLLNQTGPAKQACSGENWTSFEETDPDSGVESLIQQNRA
ncbi:NRT1/ PTR FAMILY 2.10-like protein [Drosera capensis]